MNIMHSLIGRSFKDSIYRITLHGVSRLCTLCMWANGHWKKTQHSKRHCQQRYYILDVFVLKQLKTGFNGGVLW